MNATTVKETLALYKFSFPWKNQRSSFLSHLSRQELVDIHVVALLAWCSPLTFVHSAQHIFLSDLRRALEIAPHQSHLGCMSHTLQGELGPSV